MFSAQSSTRVDFAGGTLDLWPLSVLVPDARTLNCSIDCYTKVTFEPKPGEMSLKVKSPDFEEDFHFNSIESFEQTSDKKLSLLQVAFGVLENKEKALGRWELSSESPAGSGLGGSSSLLISILKVIFQMDHKEVSQETLIDVAKNLESQVLGSSAGIQDYFSPVEKGLNSIEFGPYGYRRESLNSVLDFWKTKLSFVDSEIKHHSGMNNWDILKAYIEGEPQTQKALNEISSVALKTKEALLNKDELALKQAFEMEFHARQKVSKSYINKDLSVFLDKTKSLSRVSAFKVLGAGGGGCVMLLHKEQERENLKLELKEKGIKFLDFSLIKA